MKLLLLSLLLLQLTEISFAQLVVSNNENPLPDKILERFLGKGIAVSNPKITCAAGAYGNFSGGSSVLGLESGIVLSTTKISDLANPSSTILSESTSNPLEDPDLMTIEKLAVNDVCMVEFDLIPSCSDLEIKFVFASEEYPDFVGGFYNDAFGFFITGPNPSGGNYASKNIGTFLNGITSSVNNINANTNSSFFVDNENGENFAFNGYTVPITSKLKVVPCEKYHFKLAIADALDFIYDSGVFINLFQCSSAASATLETKQGDCSGNLAEITAKVEGGEPPYTLVWSPEPGTGQGTTTVGGLKTGVEYTLKVSDKSSCGKVFEVKTMIDGKQGENIINLQKNQVICNGESTQLVALKTNNNLSTISWKTIQNSNVSGILASGEGDIPVHSLTNLSVKKQVVAFEITPTTDGCPGKTEKYLITVLPKLVVNCKATNVLVCAGAKGQIVLNGNPNSVVEYNFDGNANQKITLNDDGMVILETEALTNDLIFNLKKNYFVDSEDCVNYSSEKIEFKVIQVPDATIAGGGALCQGDKGKVTFKGVGLTTVDFTVNGEISRLQLNSQGESILEQILNETTTVLLQEVSISTPIACKKKIDGSAIFTVVKVPDVVPTFVGVPCFGKEGAISVKGLPSLIVSYRLNQNEEQKLTLNASGEGELPLGISNSDVLFEITKIEMVDSPHCVKNVSIKNNVKIYHPQINAVTADYRQGCAPFAVQFKSLTSDVVNYKWEFGDGTTAEGGSEIGHTYSKAGTFSVKLIGVSELPACYDELMRQDFIYVENTPKASFFSSPENITNYQPTITFVNLSHDATRYKWDFGDSENSVDVSPIHTFTKEGVASYTVTLTATSDLGCTDTYSRIYFVKDNPICSVPNAFTPDFDQVNAIFAPIFAVSPVKYKFTIFDRWGAEIFKTSEINQGWNGLQGEESVQDGVYSWVLEFTTKSNEDRRLVGHVSLIK